MKSRKFLQKAFAKLDEMPAKLAREDAKKRGNQFEELVLELFANENLIIKKSYHTSDGKSEQIDGALKLGETRALLEIKWVNSGLAASELYAFLGKVEGKFVGTVGVFISREELSPNFLKSLRSGRRQSVIVIHGDDVNYIFNHEFPLKEYLIKTIDYLSYDNQNHLSASDFLRKLKRDLGSDTKLPRLIKKALEPKDYTNIIDEWVEDIDEQEAAHIVFKSLELYLLKQDSGEIGKIEKNNLMKLLSEAIEKLPDEETDADSYYFEEMSTNFIESVFSDLIEYFSDRYDLLDTDEKNTFSKRLVSQWTKNIGDYNSENIFANITDPIWSFLDSSTQTSLIKIFLSYLDSGRRSHFPQMKLALKILRQSDTDLTDPIVRDLLKENIQYWFDDDRKEKGWKEKMPEWYSRQYRKWEPYLNESIEEAIKDVVEELEDEIA